MEDVSRPCMQRPDQRIRDLKVHCPSSGGLSTVPLTINSKEGAEPKAPMGCYHQGNTVKVTHDPGSRAWCPLIVHGQVSISKLSSHAFQHYIGV
uniref:Uncharacterized protein n=1 Tax=Cannabis sativa TaxID=3483 RepID=A0A803QK28_CANSA